MQTTLFPIAGSPARRFDDERSALKDALVEFFVHSKGSSRILGLLSTKRKSIAYKALMEEIRFNAKPDDPQRPPSAIRAVLLLIQAAGLVSLTRQGFSLTEVGREVQRRIESEPAKMRTIRCSVSAAGRPLAAILSSDDRTVLRRLRKRSHTYPMRRRCW